MITDEEFHDKVKELAKDYHGFVDDLYAVIGFVYLGRIFGWQVMRIAGKRRHWVLANKLFGDLKEVLPKRTELSRRSVGLALADKLGDFWDVIRGTIAIPQDERKKLE